ncbi:helix-turn-helix domain-containing protein [Pedobacter sp. MC2016-05]|uniref:helix-turn-helix domain-containing protein n=1 Tax=Pedobacter sp. MC2016-05 TaxID=2994474 RepID=UPI002246AA0E|nr:helix-turn-helix domain-containing protein [Pedobacter sp. MC2016-05]MCX2473497.1 helix-turn-helix domain-containing protein [Pedobacter sp. MC2016-05]
MSDILPKHNMEGLMDENDFNFYKSDELIEFMSQDQNPHSHNYYILSFLYSGSILHLADFESDRIAAPAILLLDIDRVHTHPILHDCKIKSLGFSQKFITDRGPTFFSKLNKIFSRPYIKISQGEIDRIDEILGLMENKSLNSILETELTQSLLDALVIYCAILSDQNPSTEKTLNEIYSRFRILLKKHYMEHHEVSFYADSLNISTSVLTHQVKHSTAKTPKQLIDEHLLLEAKRILYWSDTTSKELSWKLGFETDSYFSRFFKKYTGLTPKEFQRTSILSRNF